MVAGEYQKQNSRAAVAAGWAALGNISMLLGNAIYMLLFDLWTNPEQKAPLPRICYSGDNDNNNLMELLEFCFLLTF